MQNIQLNIDDVIRFLKGGEAESLQIQEGTCLVLKVDREYYVPTLRQDIVNIIQQTVFQSTGIAVGVFLTFKDTDLEQRTEAELIDMRTKADLMIARYAEKRLFDRSKN